MIIRVAKNADNPYVMMNKTGLNDPRLSFKAKGILAYLLSKPDHWEVRVADLAKHAKDGRDSVRAGLKQLREFGYAVYEQPRSMGRFMDGGYTIYEVPQTGNPSTENTEPSNNDCSNEDECSDEHSSAPKRTRKQSELDCLKAELVSHFIELTRLPRPSTRTKSQCLAAARLWWQPLVHIADVCDRDVERSKQLISWAILHMDQEELTISNPKSIEKVATGEQAKRKRSGGTHQRYGEPAYQSTDPRAPGYVIPVIELAREGESVLDDL